MSSIVQSITGGGTNNAGFTAQSANLQNPTTTAQAGTAYDQTQTGLQQQQAFLQALQAQNGTQNQSNVYNQLQGVANGTGPNPAQAQLAQATGANVSNQAALMAGQRGTSANAGLLARQAAQQGAATQQNAAGQAASLQAQQSLGALGQAGTIAGQQVTNQGNAANAYSSSAQGQQSNLLNSINSQNNAAVSNASQQNSANAELAKTNATAGQNTLGNLTGALGSAAQMIPGALSSVASNVNNLGMTQTDLSGMLGSGAEAGGAADATAGGAGAVGDLLSTGIEFAATGGQIGKNGLTTPGPQSKVGQHIHMLAKGGKVPALVSPGERYLNPQAVKAVEKGADPIKAGTKIPGKPKVSGAKNSYANDTVPASLDDGGIVLPRSVTQAKNPHWAAHKFVSAIMQKQGKSLPKKGK